MPKYQDRDELRKVVANAGGVKQALYGGLLSPLDMPDDEMRFQAKDLKMVSRELRSHRPGEENPVDVSVQMFEHALGMEMCESRNAGARWIMGERQPEC